MTPMLCTCGAHQYTLNDLQPGQSVTCFRCHDIFQRRGDQLVIMYRPPDAVYQRLRDDYLKEKA